MLRAALRPSRTRRGPTRLSVERLEGRDLPTTQPFTIVALPDTQFYAQSYPQTFLAQTQWVADNRANENIAFVSHLGDIVQSAEAGPNRNLTQWTRADAAIDLLDGNLAANPDGLIPYSVAIGNHDYGQVGVKSAGSARYREFFGAQRYAGRSWYGGASPDGLSHYQTFEAGGWTFLHLTLEWEPEPADVAWAQSVLDAHPDLPTIITTHSYLRASGAGRTTTTETPGAVSGETLFQTLVRPNAQVFMVLNGHFSGEYHQTSVNAAGQPVFEMVSDYQSDPLGGGGYLRLITFAPDLDRIFIRSYSPVTGAYYTDADSQFSFTVDFVERFGPRTFRVTDVEKRTGDQGFVVTFSDPLDPAGVNLYADGTTYGLDQRDVQISRDADGDGAFFEPEDLNFGVFGSNASEAADEQLSGFRFTAHSMAPNKLALDYAGGTLPDGRYRVRLRSSSAFESFRSGADRLDGDGDELIEATDDFTTGGAIPDVVIQRPANAVTVRLPDFAVGPVQPLRYPNLIGGPAGLPLSVSSGSGVNRVAFDLRWDPTLLSLTGFTPTAGVTATVSSGSYASGSVRLTLTPTSAADFAAAVGAAGVLGRFQGGGTSAAAAAYTRRQVLDLSGLSVTGSVAFAAADDDGLHLNAYPGDVIVEGTGPVHDSADAAALSAYFQQRRSGFADYRNTDPMLVGDVNSDGRIGSADASAVRARFLGRDLLVPAPPLGSGGLTRDGTGLAPLAPSAPAPRALYLAPDGEASPTPSRPGRRRGDLL